VARGGVLSVAVSWGSFPGHRRVGPVGLEPTLLRT
jgi:hypothetical protein